MPKIKFIYAFARWNIDTQEWELSSTDDYLVCEEIKELP